MEIKDFISQTLQQIELALQEAANATGKEYSVYASDGRTVKFSLAVTDTQGSEATSSKGGGAHIKVISADIGKSTKDSAQSELVSRIEFSVYVPD